MLIDKALNRGYVLSPLGGTSPPSGGAGLSLALQQGQAIRGPSPGGGRGNNRMAYERSPADASFPRIAGPAPASGHLSEGQRGLGS